MLNASHQIAEKRLDKKKKAVAQHVENYKIRKEALLRESVIMRSGYAFDAPSRTISGSGERCARCVTPRLS